MSDDNWFRIEDFRSIEVQVEVENLTTKTGVHDDTRVLGSEEVLIEGSDPLVRLMEFDEHTLALDVPYRTAASGHLLQVTIDVSGVALPFCFELRGKVAHLEPLEDHRERMVIELQEFEPRFYEALKNIFKTRQSEIDSFLKQVRGG